MRSWFLLGYRYSMQNHSQSVRLDFGPICRLGLPIHCIYVVFLGIYADFITDASSEHIQRKNMLIILVRR